MAVNVVNVEVDFHSNVLRTDVSAEAIFTYALLNKLSRLPTGAALEASLAEKVPTTRKINEKRLSGDITLTKADLGLGDVDNTSDANKPISIATQAALDQIDEDLQSVEGDVSDLKSALNNVSNPNLLPSMKTGYYLNGSGEEVANASSAYTEEYIKVTPGETYGVSFNTAASGANYYLRVQGYNTSKVWQSQIEQLYISSSYVGPWQQFFTIPTGIEYIRVGFYSWTSLNNVYIVKMDNGQYITAQDRVARINATVAEAASTKNLFTVEAWENGSIAYATGANTTNSSRIRTIGFLPVNASKIYSTNSNVYFMLYAYNNDGSYVGAWHNGAFDTADVTIVRSVDLYELSKIYDYKYRVAITIPGGTARVETISDVYIDSIIDRLVYNPINITVLGYNIGKFNYGYEHSSSHVTDIDEKVANYKKYFGKINPDVMLLAECTRSIDTSDSYNSDDILFMPLMNYKAYFHENVAYTVFPSVQINGDQGIYLRDNNASYVGAVGYLSAKIGNKKACLAGGFLRVYNTATERLEAFQNFLAAIASYDYSIIYLDTNVQDDTERETLYNAAVSAGYTVCNGGYFGLFDTLVPTSLYKPIDNIFVRGNIKIKNFYVATDDEYNDLSSDHKPIVAELCLY